jgi:hypothetical protein
MIRHAGVCLTLPIATLPVAMIQPAFGAALMAPVGFAALPPPRSRTACHATVALPSVTVRTDEKQYVASAALTKPRTENCLAMYRHAPCARALTVAIRSWDVRTSFDAWFAFP